MTGQKLVNTNTALYTDTTGCSENIGMKKVYKGAGYGVTMESLHKDANEGRGYLEPTRVQYSNCDASLRQKGGNKNLGLSHPSLAETRFNNEAAPSYGYNVSSVDDSHTFRGSYPTFTKNPANQQCGGRRRKSRRKSKRRPKRKSRRKSKRRPKRRPKRKSRRKLKKCKNCGVCHRGKCKRVGKKCICKTKKRKYRRRKRRMQRGGSSIFYSGVDSAIDNNTARILKSDLKANMDNCGDNYNHFNKSKSDMPNIY